MSEPSQTPTHVTRYRLYLAWSGINLRLGDNGITPEPEGLRFTREGRQEFRAYKDIFSINLSMTSMPRMADMAKMTIRFRNGLTMHVLNTNSWGAADAEQTQLYYRFKADLHERLVGADLASALKFTTGMTGGRSKFLTASLVVAAAFFVLLPLVLFFMTGNAQALLIMLAGAAFVYPLLRSTKRNQPGTYDPRHPPDMLS